MKAWRMLSQTSVDRQVAAVIPKDSVSLVFAGRMRAEFHCVAPILDDLRKWLSLHEFGQDHLGTIEIVMAEALNNAVEHGGLRSQQAIEVLARITASCLRIVVIDQGKPYPNGSLPGNSAPDIDDLPEGGFGWMMIHELTSDLTYQRHAGRNLLTLIFERQ